MLGETASVMREELQDDLMNATFEPFCRRFWWGVLYTLCKLPLNRTAAVEQLKATRTHWDTLQLVDYVDHTGAPSTFRAAVEPYIRGLTAMWAPTRIDVEVAIDAAIEGLSTPTSDAELVEFLVRTARNDPSSFPLLNRNSARVDLLRVVEDLPATVRGHIEAGHLGSLRRIVRRCEEKLAGDDD